MTEDDAKQKWCPMVRFIVLREEGMFAGTKIDERNCIGSSCMMWHGFPKMKVDMDKDTIEWIPCTDGYCGLAGKP